MVATDRHITASARQCGVLERGAGDSEDEGFEGSEYEWSGAPVAAAYYLQLSAAVLPQPLSAVQSVHSSVALHSGSCARWSE